MVRYPWADSCDLWADSCDAASSFAVKNIQKKGDNGDGGVMGDAGSPYHLHLQYLPFNVWERDPR